MAVIVWSAALLALLLIFGGSLYLWKKNKASLALENVDLRSLERRVAEKRRELEVQALLIEK